MVTRVCSGPSAKRYRLQGNITTHTPKDYVDVFKHHKVNRAVVLLCCCAVCLLAFYSFYRYQSNSNTFYPFCLRPTAVFAGVCWPRRMRMHCFPAIVRLCFPVV